MKEAITQAIQKIKEARHIVLLTHIDPDADTLGSALGLYHSLLALNKRASVINTTKLPYNLDFLPGIDKIKKELPKRYDLMISFDCGSFDRLGIEKKEFFLINIDHHRSNTMYGDINIVDPAAVATSEVVYALLEKGGMPIPKESAISLYTALVDDTGFFKYEGVGARTFELAKKLCEKGASPEWVARMLAMREPLSKLRLLPLVLQTLTLHLNAKVASLRLTQQMLAQTGATKEMGEEALHMARNLATVEVALLLREEEDGGIKVSMRSKERVDVGKIAVAFGGGGHKRAAGFISDLHDFDRVLHVLLEAIKKEME